MTSPPASLATTTKPPLTTGPLPRSAAVERDGVRVTIVLDASPLRAGHPTWVTTTVENVGSDDLIWFHDGCGIALDVRDVLDGARWRLGISQSGVGRDFKDLAVERLGLESGAIHIDFVPEQYVGRGRYGCMDVGISDRIRPGEVIRQRALWGGSVWFRLGPPPSGLLHLTGSFRYYWRAHTGQPGTITSQVIDVPLEAAIVGGRDPKVLDPPEVIDAALASAPFLEWLGGRRIGDGNEPILRFDEQSGLWQVGLIEYDVNRFHLVLVDPLSGEVTGSVDLPWNPEVDGNP